MATGRRFRYAARRSRAALWAPPSDDEGRSVRCSIGARSPLWLLLGLTVFGCAGSPTTTVLPGPTVPKAVPATASVTATQPAASEPTRARACPGLDSRLDQVARSADPLLTARQLGLRVEGDSIQVVLVLGAGEVDELAGLGVRASTRVGDQVQAFIPIHLLCEVAATDVVETILAPSEAVPLN
jgi:hypothetical protein